MPNDASVDLGSVERQRQGEAENTFIDKVVNNYTDVLPTLQEREPKRRKLSLPPAVDMFVHEPLQLNAASIRLVEILPPGDDGMIRCSIFHTTLDSLFVQGTEIEYSCLSYVWGAPQPVRRISVNGKPFYVRQNLYGFLQTVSFLQEGRALSDVDTEFQYIWIDALCIDQESTKERNHQVQQMGRIYLGARRVIAWMGNDLDMKALFRLTSVTSSGDPFKDESESLRAFCSHEYWQRAWITQETILGRDIYFAGQGCAIGIGRLRALGAASDLHIKTRPIDPSPLDDLLKGLCYGPGLLDIVQNFERYQHKKCANVRDMAYSLLAISRDASNLKVDYGRSCVDVARDLLALDDKGNCMCHVEIVLHGLQIYRKSSEDTSLLIEMQSSAMLRHMSPCTHCGERNALESVPLPQSARTRSRFICLHCNHYWLPRLVGLHRRAHLGHLVFIPSKSNLENASAGLLLWSPLGGEWHEITGYKRAVVSENGRVKALALSVGAICELIALLAAHDQISRPDSSTYEAHSSMSNWQTTS